MSSGALSSLAQPLTCSVELLQHAPLVWYDTGPGCCAGVATPLADVLSNMRDAARAAPLHGRAPDSAGPSSSSSSREVALAGGIGLTGWAPSRSSLLPAGPQHRCRSLLLLGLVWGLQRCCGMWHG